MVIFFRPVGLSKSWRCYGCNHKLNCILLFLIVVGVILLYSRRIQSCIQAELLFAAFSICGITVVCVSDFIVGISYESWM